MKKLDQRGVAALEFCLVAVPLFTLMFAIFDLGRYAITMQSLRMLANAGARTEMINCVTDAVIQKTSPTACTGDPLPSVAAKKAVAPFLYAGGLTPTLNIPAPAKGATALTVTASQPNFTMLMPIWGAAFNKPNVTASTSIPF
jgi:TadE-like protein